MEWKQERISKPELEKKQNDYIRMAMEMAQRSPVPQPKIVTKAAPKAVETPPPPAPEVHIEEAPTVPAPEVTPEPEKVVVEEKKPKKPPAARNNNRNKSKKIEINADININSPLVVNEHKTEIVQEIVEERIEQRVAPQVEIVVPEPEIEVVPEPEPEVVPMNPVAEATPEPEPEGVVFPDEICEEIREEDEVTDMPFENFGGCGECESNPDKPRPRRCENSTPPNFNNFVKEHNQNRANCGNSRNHPYNNNNYPWKNKKN